MARVPISFYLNILAGILVLFNHYASSETGDVALNKVTGAAGRFYTLFRDTITLQHGWVSRLETMLCEPAVDSVLPHDAAEFLRACYCDGPAQAAESAGETSNDQQPRGGYGSSDLASMYYRPPDRPRVQPLEPRISAEDLLRKLPFGLGWPSQSHLSRAVWEWSSEMATIRMLLLHVWASHWWFKSPLQVTGVLAAALSAFDYVIRASGVSQIYTSVVADFLRCIEWEALRQVVDVGVVMMDHVYVVVTTA